MALSYLAISSRSETLLSNFLSNTSSGEVQAHRPPSVCFHIREFSSSIPQTLSSVYAWGPAGSRKAVSRNSMQLLRDSLVAHGRVQKVLFPALN